MIDNQTFARMFRWKRLSAKSQDFHDVPAVSANDDLANQTDHYITRLKAGDFDFIDLGTCDGGGFTIAEKQGGRKGLGFDLEPSAVRRALAKGLDVALYDICDLQTEGACTDFAVCSHILEHLPSLKHIEGVLKSLVKICRGYLLISGPLFEHEEYLNGLGIKVLHSLMLDHTCKVKIGELQQILHNLECRDYVIALTEPLENSSNIWLYSAAQSTPPEGLWTYDTNLHLPKPTVKFDRIIHRDFVCVVRLDVETSYEQILGKFHWGFDRVVVQSDWKY